MSRKATEDGVGCGLILAGVAIYMIHDAIGGRWGIFLLVVATVGAIGFALYKMAESEDKKRAKEEAERRRQRLIDTYGPEVASRILRCIIAQGDTVEIVHEMFGEPEAVTEKVSPTRARYVLKYGQLNARSFRLKVTIEDGVVIGWETT